MGGGNGGRRWVIVNTANIHSPIKLFGNSMEQSDIREKHHGVVADEDGRSPILISIILPVFYHCFKLTSAQLLAEICFCQKRYYFM